MVDKFGLTELERYMSEVGFKKSDVRTIRGVCSIVGLPLTVVPEAQEIIAVCGKDIVASEKRIVMVEAEDAKSAENYTAQVARLADERKATRNSNLLAISLKRLENRDSNEEIVRLQKLLRPFA